MHSEPVPNQTREMDQSHEEDQSKPANKHDQLGESDQPHENIQNIHDLPDEMDQPVISNQHNEPNNQPFNNQDKPENWNQSADHDQPRKPNKYLPDDLGRYLGPNKENDTDSDTTENEQTEKDEAKDTVQNKEYKSVPNVAKVYDIGRVLGGHEAQNASDLDDGKNLTIMKTKQEFLKILDLGKIFIIAAVVFALFAIIWLLNKETTQGSTKESCGIPSWIFNFKFAQSCTEYELYVLHMDPRPWHLDEDDDWILSVHFPRPCLPNTTHQQHATENNHSTSHLRIPVSRQQLGQYNVPELQLQDHEESVSLENEYLRIGNALEANGAEEIIVINTDNDLYQPAIPNTTCDVRVAEEARTTNEHTMEENSQCAKLNDINGEQRNQAGVGLQIESIFQDGIPSEQHTEHNMVETNNPAMASRQELHLSMLSDDIAWDNMPAHTEYINNDSIMNESLCDDPASSTGIGRRKEDIHSWSSQQIARDRFFLTDFQTELNSEDSMFARNNATTIKRHELYLSPPETPLLPCDNMSAYTVNSTIDYIMSENPSADPTMSTVFGRIQTFTQGWSHILPSPQRMAEAGFFFTGVDDVVRCFSCDVCIRQWLPEDDPTSEHVRWSPDCCFIQQRISFQNTASEPPNPICQETSNINADDHLLTRTMSFTSELVAFSRSEGSDMQRHENNRNHGNQSLAGTEEHHEHKRANKHRPSTPGLNHSNVQHSNIAQPLGQVSSERIRANNGHCKTSIWDGEQGNTFEAGRPCGETGDHSHTDRLPTPCLNDSSASETVTSHYGVKQNRMKDEMRNGNNTYQKSLKMKKIKLELKNTKVIAAKPRPERPADRVQELTENTTYSRGNISTNRLNENSAPENIPRHRNPTSAEIEEVLESEDGVRVLAQGYAPTDVARAVLRLLEDGVNFNLSYARIIGVLRILRRRPRKTNKRKTP